jgi:hypothetical protein
MTEESRVYASDMTPEEWHAHKEKEARIRIFGADWFAAPAKPAAKEPPPKRATEMTEAEYRASLAALLRNPQQGRLTAAERADLAERRGEEPKDAREMTAMEYAMARAKAVRGQ